MGYLSKQKKNQMQDVHARTYKIVNYCQLALINVIVFKVINSLYNFLIATLF